MQNWMKKRRERNWSQPFWTTESICEPGGGGERQRSLFPAELTGNICGVERELLVPPSHEYPSVTFHRINAISKIHRWPKIAYTCRAGTGCGINSGYRPGSTTLASFVLQLRLWNP